MTQETYRRMTDMTRHFVSRFPHPDRVLQLPTLICAVFYLVQFFMLAVRKDNALMAYALIPLFCFLTVSILRRGINRQRPYDAFGIAPVGTYTPGKGKSMPSRHAASAVAILLAFLWLQPPVFPAVIMILATLLVCLLRIFAGRHYPSDVLAGAGLSLFLWSMLLPVIEAFPFHLFS